MCTRTEPDLGGSTSDVSIRWIGHATVLIEAAGVRILTDPLLTRRAAHLRRRVALPDLGRVDAVLLSHAHMDHFHVASLRRVVPGAQLVVPEGAARLLRGTGPRQVDEVRSGSIVTVRGRDGSGGSVTVEVVPANHRSGRGPQSAVRSSPVGFVLRAGGRAVYFAGDTDLFPAMRRLGPLDAALLPIWGWGSTLGEGHLDPQSAATATAWLDPTMVIPIHWGTYRPLSFSAGSPAWFSEPPVAFRRALHGMALEDRLQVLQPGEALHFGVGGTRLGPDVTGGPP